MKKINSFIIGTNNLPSTALSRQYSIRGEKDAEFILQIFNSSQQFYNFGTESFSATFTSRSSLNAKMYSSVYYGSINFPANASGDTYTILLLAPLDKNTELTFGSGKHSYSTTITQVVNTTLTFTPATTNGASYKTFPSSVTSTHPPMLTSSVTKNVDWDVVNTDSDANGFGLRLIRQPINTDWYFETTETADGAVASDSNQLVVDDLTDLATGMELTYITGTTAPGAATRITAINTTTKTLTLSRNQAITDGHTMTFTAKGSAIIKKAIGADIDFSNWNVDVTSATSAELTKTVRTTATGTTVNLNGTYGISGGGFVTISGINIANTSANTVQSVSASSSAGGVVMEVAQTVKAGSKIYFTGSTQTITLSNTLNIHSHPSSNKTILLLVDNFITTGVAS